MKLSVVAFQLPSLIFDEGVQARTAEDSIIAQFDVR
jgi:hypothetical protein